MPHEEAQSETVVETPAEGAPQETGDPLLDALAAMPEVPAETDHEEKTDPDSPAAKKDEKEKKPEPPPNPATLKGRELEDFLLSPEQLAKPEGVTKAADFLSRKRSKLDAIEMRAKERARTTHVEREAAQNWFAEENAKLDDARGKARYVNQILETLEKGELSQVLETLGTLRKKPGIEVWEGLAKLAINGKRPEKNVEAESLRSELAELRRTLEERDERRETDRMSREEQAEVERLKPMVAEREAAVLQAAGDATKYPTISGYLALEAWKQPVLDEVAQQRRAARAKGQTLDLSTVLGNIEAALSRKGTPAGVKPAVPASETHAGTKTATVTSIAPSQARSAPVVRDKTEDELAADLARDPAALERILGISLG